MYHHDNPANQSSVTCAQNCKSSCTNYKKCEGKKEVDGMRSRVKSPNLVVKGKKIGREERGEGGIGGTTQHQYKKLET